MSGNLKSFINDLNDRGTIPFSLPFQFIFIWNIDISGLNTSYPNPLNIIKDYATTHPLFLVRSISLGAINQNQETYYLDGHEFQLVSDNPSNLRTFNLEIISRHCYKSLGFDFLSLNKLGLVNEEKNIGDDSENSAMFFYPNGECKSSCLMPSKILYSDNNPEQFRSVPFFYIREPKITSVSDLKFETSSKNNIQTFRISLVCQDIQMG